MAADTTTTTQARSWSLKLKLTGINPVLIKELRSRMRGPRAFLILTGFLLLLSGVAFLLYKALETSFRYASGPAGMSAMVGISMFLGLAFFELLLIAFLTPALTAGAISGEQEALTYEMLVATPLRASSIMLGKMIAALSYVFLLIVAAVPLLSLVYIFGGVTVRDMATALLVLAATALTFGTVGIFWSALLKRTGRATVMSYLTLLGFILVPYVLAAIWQLMQHEAPLPGLQYANPFTAMMSVVDLGPEMGVNFDPLSGLFFGLFGGPPIEYHHPVWHWTLALYTLITVTLGLLTVFLVRPSGQRQVTRGQVLGSVLIVALLIGGFSQLFTREDWQQILESPDITWQRMQGGPGIQVEPAIIEERIVITPTAVADPAIERPQEGIDPAPEPTPAPLD